MHDSMGDIIKLVGIIAFPVLIIISLIINTFYYNEVNNSPLLSIFADPTATYMLSLIKFIYSVRHLMPFKNLSHI